MSAVNPSSPGRLTGSHPLGLSNVSSIKSRISNWWWGSAPAVLTTEESSTSDSLPYRKAKKELFALLRSLPRTEEGRPQMTVDQFQKSAELLLAYESEFLNELNENSPVECPKPVILANIPRFENPPQSVRTVARRVLEYYKDADRSEKAYIRFGDDNPIQQKMNQDLVIKTIVQKYAEFLLENNHEIVGALLDLDYSSANISETLEFALFNRKTALSTGMGKIEFSLDVLDHLEPLIHKFPEFRREQIAKLTILKTIEIVSHMFQGVIGEVSNSIQFKLVMAGYTTKSQNLTYEYHLPRDFKSITIVMRGKNDEPSETTPLYCPFDFVKKLTIQDLSKLGDDFPENNGFGTPFELTFGDYIKLDQALELVKTLEVETVNPASESTSEIHAAQLGQFISLAINTPVKQKSESYDVRIETIAFTSGVRPGTPTCSSSDMISEIVEVADEC